MQVEGADGKLKNAYRSTFIVAYSRLSTDSDAHTPLYDEVPIHCSFSTLMVKVILNVPAQFWVNWSQLQKHHPSRYAIGVQ